MKRSKQSKAQLAQKAISAAISEETQGLRAELAAKDIEIARLRGLLSSIVHIASRERAEVAALGPAFGHVMVKEEPVPEGPAAPLADEDTLGEGRWA